VNEIAWSAHAPYPLLALLQLVPLVGAALLYRWREHGRASWLGWAFVAGELLLALDLYQRIDATQAAFQFAERLPLLGPFGYHAAADGVTVLFILLTAVVIVLVAAYVRARALPERGLLFSVLLLIESVLVSGLATLNLLWFALASAAEVLLAGFLILRWAVAEHKRYATLRFYQFQASGLLMLLCGVLLAGWQHADANGGDWSFDLLAMAAAPIGGSVGWLVFYLLFYGLAVRTPLFPFHGWLATVATHGNLALAPAILLGVKLGLYGLIRFVFPIVPEAVLQWHIYAMAFAATGIFYSAFLAFLQDNLRTLMAYAVVSHTSLAVVGLFSLHGRAFQGSVLMAASFGLSATAMFFMTGFIFHRTRTTALSNLGSLIDPLPLIGTAFFVSALAIVGMPGTPGFDAFHLVLEAGIRQFGALPTVGAALANVAAAGFLLWGFQRAFLAPRASYLPSQAIDRATPTENLIAVAVIAIIAICGFYMTPWLDLVEAPLKVLAARFGHD
jgi:NADH-quinone oxidoreductase subunit M